MICSAPYASEAILVVLILKAFAAGCTALMLKTALLFRRGVVVIDIPYHLDR